MYSYETYKYFLLLVDAFSTKVFVRPLITKTSAEVSRAFKDIFEEFAAKIYVLETDQGKEFLGKPCKDLFNKNHIIYKSKIGKNKAFLAEHYIFLVKKYLYMTLRGTLNKNWIEVLGKCVENMNNTQVKKIGYLKPNQINSEIDSAFVRNAQKRHNIDFYTEPSWKTQLKNEQNYTVDLKLIKIGDYVYRDVEQKLFDKSYDVSVI